MIIDFHTHTFPDHIAERAVQKLRRSSRIRAYSDGTAEGLRRSAAAAGIGLSVIQPVATSADQVDHINARAIRMNQEEAERFSERGSGMLLTGKESRLLSFGCMHPEYEYFREELRRIAEAGVPGIKLHAYFQECDMDDLRYLRILDAAAENGLIVLVHAGYDQGFPGEHSCTVPMLRRIMREIKGITMIAAHMGGWKEWDQVPDLLADTGIYLDTSFATGSVEPEPGEEIYWNTGQFAPDPGMTTYRQREERKQAGNDSKTDQRKPFRDRAEERSVFGNCRLLDPEAFAAVVKAFPEGHILFATDSPWSDPDAAIAFVRSSPLPAETKKSILGDAARRLLGIRI